MNIKLPNFSSDSGTKFDKPIGHTILSSEQVEEDQYNYVQDRKSDALSKESQLREISSILLQNQLKDCKIKKHNSLQNRYIS
jgi:hypothetical protein